MTTRNSPARTARSHEIEERRYGGRQDHVKHDLYPRSAEHARRVEIDRLDIGHRLDGGEREREVDADEHDEDRRPVADPEGHDGERDPGDRGDRREQRDRGKRQLSHDAEVEGERAGQDARDEGEEEADEHPLHARDDGGEGDEVRARPLHTDRRHKELRLVADLADELVRRRKNDRVDQVQGGRRLPDGHDDPDGQHPPHAGASHLAQSPPRLAPPATRRSRCFARERRGARLDGDPIDHADFTFTFL
jgi:hypothetical protein